jgi:hypothetical protein
MVGLFYFTDSRLVFLFTAWIADEDFAKTDKFLTLQAT